MSEICFDDIYYYIKPTDSQVDEWDDLPEAIKSTYEAGHPRGGAQVPGRRDCAVRVRGRVPPQLRGPRAPGRHLLRHGHGAARAPEIVKQYFGTVIPRNDNKFSALNSVWSGGSFIYVPPGVEVGTPLQAYFRINAENMGQFERTLIIADKGVEGALHRGLLGPGVPV